MKKILSMLLGFWLCCAVGAIEIKQFELDGFKFASFNVEVRSLGDGAFELTILPTPGQWPMIHIIPPELPKQATWACITLKQVYPEGATPKRLNLVFQPPAAASEVPLREVLADNRPHSFETALHAEAGFTHFSVNAHSNDDKIILRISNLKARRDDTVLTGQKARLEPLPPVLFKGKPFFPIGAWDLDDIGQTPHLIDPGFLAAGGNIAEVGIIGLPGHPFYEKHRQPVLYPRLEALTQDPAGREIAWIIGLDAPLVMDASEAEVQGLGGYHKPVAGPELDRREALLSEDLRRLRNYPNILGYMLDEPENLAWPYYKKHFADDWQKRKDHGLSDMMQQWFAWFHQAIRREHPEAKLMPVLAWWTTYESAQGMYDVIMPNAYPEAKDLAEVNYDAALAVQAARLAGGGRTVIYVPAMFDNLRGAKSILTRPEQRYVCFAPLTRGVMGILGWRLARCSRTYRDTVVFPVMKEVSDLRGFFLGEWHDELVTSDHDRATAPYLQEFKERVRLMSNEEDGEVIKVRDAVPDVSYCLRRDPKTGKYLLLAVNNRREPVTVNFEIALSGLPAVMVDTLDCHQVRLEGNRFRDEFMPFDVHAYVFELNGQGE